MKTLLFLVVFARVLFATIQDERNLAFQLICNTSMPDNTSNDTVTQFILYKKGNGTFIMTQGQDVTSLEATFNMTAGLDVQYTCRYKKIVNMSHITSNKNYTFTVTIVRLPQTNISLTTPHTELVWGPGHSEVTRGDSFSITCSILPQYPGGIFNLTSVSNMTDMKAAVNHSASFQGKEAEFYEHQGNYSCEVTVSSQTFTSNSSELLVDEPSLDNRTSPGVLLVAMVTSGSVLFLLLSLVAVYLFFRRRQAEDQDQTQSPVLVGRNFYEDSYEEEMSAMNTEEQKREGHLKAEEETREDEEVESETYVNMEDEGEEKYIEVLAEEEEVEQQEEEEEDYINVADEEDYIEVLGEEEVEENYVNIEDEEEKEEDYVNVDAEMEKGEEENDIDMEDTEDEEEDYVNLADKEEEEEEEEEEEDNINLEDEQHEENYINLEDEHDEEDYVNVDDKEKVEEEEEEAEEENYVNLEDEQDEEDYVNIEEKVRMM